MRAGDVELARRLGVRVRDPAWGTLLATVDDLAVQQDETRFDVSFRAAHDDGQIRFSWQAAIAGESAVLTYEMDGVAETAFAYGRIGLVVLHPPALTAGRPYRARGPAGETRDRFPELVGPQPIVDGVIYPLFPAFQELEIDAGGGLSLLFEFAGDVFEVEDQRNWTDGSFKTYSTPVGLPGPHNAEAGQRFRQSVRLSVRGQRRPSSRKRRRPGHAEVTLGPPLDRAVPAIGLGSPRTEPADDDRRLLRALRPAHVRAELEASADPVAQLAAASRTGELLGVPLELAIRLVGNEDESRRWLSLLSDAIAVLDRQPDRLLVHHSRERVTGSRWAALAREALAPRSSVSLVGGTEENFAELNRAWPGPAARFDGLAWSINPQVHDSDDLSVMQTLAAQADTVRTAHARAHGRSLHVSPVLLRPRDRDDTRHAALFGAAWTVGSAKALCEAGVDSISYFEPSGPGGVACQGRVLPVYHVLHDLCAWRGAHLLAAEADAPEAVAALAVRGAGGDVGLLVANLTPEPLALRVGPLPSGSLDLSLGPYDVARDSQPGLSSTSSS